MKKTLALLMALVLLVTAFAGCTEKAPEAEAAKTLTVGFDAEFPPYGYIDDAGEYDGFDLALAEEVCNRLGWEFKAQAIVWDSKDAELEAGNIDCIWNGFTMSAERESQYSWTVPYVDNTQVIVVKDDSGIASLADLAGKTVMAQAGSSALSALEGNAELSDTFGELLEVADYNSGFMELDNGTIDALAMDVGVANYQIATRGGGFTILDESIASEVYAVGFLLGNDELKYTVQGVLLEMAEDGTMLEIAQNYVDKGLVIESLTLVG
jgi:polar amino acid transport system substrate-binding protein